VLTCSFVVRRVVAVDAAPSAFAIGRAGRHRSMDRAAPFGLVLSFGRFGGSLEPGTDDAPGSEAFGGSNVRAQSFKRKRFGGFRTA
jgi:hypothetical protein